MQQYHNLDRDYPLISICMPIYNRPALLKNALDHVIAQSYKNIEIIVSDDCSPNEKVRCVLREYAKQDKRIKPFYQEKNLGALPNQEFAIEQASGEYIMIHSEDDYVEKDYIKTCYEFLSSHPDYSMACGTCISEKFDLRGNQLKNVSKYPVDDPRLLEVSSAKKRYINLFSNLKNYYLFSGLIRKRTYTSIHQYKSLGHDLIYLSGIAYTGKIAIINKSDSGFHRGGVVGTNKDFIKLLGLLPIERYFPHTRLIIYSVLDILFLGDIYKNMGIIKRFFFASRVFFIALYVLSFRYIKRESIYYSCICLKKILPSSAYEKLQKLYNYSNKK